ncbi:hypothetical protein C0Q70_16397 [Pomacea canaliculata]|uniref:RNB domain-containing protein n=1 Tax=Pomacea canaliculata TaxID=400727 RepID=A0A2T7NPN4_POMCA|nr:hypothetical protein C0Q70_16397 [Pomacea canaliculata]
MDYLCIRCRVKCEESTVSRVNQSCLKCVVDDHYTWVGHGGVVAVTRKNRKDVAVTHKNRKDEDGGLLQVTFLLSPHSSAPPSQLLTSSGYLVTLEVLPKSRRAQEMLFQLEDKGNELAQAIAFQRRIPKLDENHQNLGLKKENQEIRVPSVKLPTNNHPQHKAIESALTNSVCLIQGPPGLLKLKFGNECPKMVRLTGLPLNPKITQSLEVIIDECAMSPEPHSLVPIVANKAKQVVLLGDHKQLRPIITCQAAAELGLDQSLFERGEWDYVVLSTVRSLPSYKIEPHPTYGWCRQNMGFITDQNQVNVALTRARRGIIIVGNSELLKCDPVWNRLLTRYEDLGCVYESADFPPSLLAPQPRVRPHRQPVASTELFSFPLLLWESLSNSRTNAIVAEDDDDHLAKFKDDAEKLFENAETKLMQHVKHYMAQGCPEADLEAAVLERASVTASWLAAGAEKNQTEFYNPHQTVVYLYSALSVSSLSLNVAVEHGQIHYKLSESGRKCLDLLDQLQETKTKTQNLIWLADVLVNLACWVELTRPHISYYIVSQKMWKIFQDNMWLESTIPQGADADPASIPRRAGSVTSLNGLIPQPERGPFGANELLQAGFSESTPDLGRMGSREHSTVSYSSTSEPPAYSSESETDDDEDEENKFQIIRYDDDDDEPMEDVLSKEPISTALDDEKDWLEKSMEELEEPGQARRLQGKEIPGQESESVVEKMAHGCVVGMYPSRRVRFRDVEHPVLICTQDEIEGHLMKPLCKTVPKIHVMNDKVKEKYPALTKHRLEIKKIVNGKVEFKRFLDVDPDKREQYVFKVVILSWRVQSIYPLGAILEAHIGGKDFGSGLQVLTLQHNAPGVYPRKVIHETQALKLEDFPQRTGRLDLTSKRIVTIDPPGSQDLDDALNISKEQSGFVVGIHIADVASFVKVERKPRPMFPEPLSHGVLSLLPGQERLALSVFFRFDKKGNLKTNEEPRVKKTIIKSTRQFSYEEIQKVIDGDQHINVDQDTRMDVLDLHMIASQLREARIGKGGLFVPFEDPRLHDIDSVADSLQAHSLVEEFMVLANKSIAKRLRQKFPHVMILRSHKPPTYEQLAEWREKEGNIANLVMQLQGKKTSPSTKLSVSAGVQGHDMFPQNRHVIVQEHLYHRICECLEEENLDEARRLLFMDALHPLQCLAYQHWMEMMETAEYKCSHGLNQPDHYHFGLDIEYYTHFTSPIRRYVDLHVHRLLHADLDGKAPDCKAEDVVRLCQHLNNVDARQKAFGRGCRALAIAEKLQTNPLVFRAFVDNVDSEQLIFCLPSLLSVSDRKQEVSFSMLGVSSQPKVITDTVQKKDMATVCWETRLYNQHGTSSRELVVKRKYVEREAYQNHVPSSVPIDIPINPNQLTVNVSQKEWAGMLRLLMDSNCTELPDIPAVIERVRSEVDHISSENGDGQYQCAEFASA